MRRIGLLNVRGAMPCLEEFAHLPTDLVDSSGRVDGERASEVLDLLILPGGSLVESGIQEGLREEILRMGEEGKWILGVCSGFELLSRRVDIGRLSPEPIYREGLGLLDVEFRPLICTEWVEARVVEECFLTEGVSKVQGFHAHTYGEILPGTEKVVLKSSVGRLNYKPADREIVSGVVNREGTVLGSLVHRLLDENPRVLASLLSTLGITLEDYREIQKRNERVMKKLRREVGVGTEVHAGRREAPPLGRALLIASVGTGSGKTFLTSGIAGALRRRGYRINVCKIGSDVRDLMPALYLLKAPMKKSSSLRIGRLGWEDPTALAGVFSAYDLTLIEGAMGLFTGLLKAKEKRLNSAIEVAALYRLPLLLLLNCEKGGIEGALAELHGYVQVARALGVEVGGVVLNKAYFSRGEADALGAPVPLLAVVPKLSLGHRGTIPEVELRLEEFSEEALSAAEAYVDVDRVLSLAKRPECPAAVPRDLPKRFREALKLQRSHRGPGTIPFSLSQSKTEE
jgi:cobyrinic acid a,c-diamide synthase